MGPSPHEDHNDHFDTILAIVGQTDRRIGWTDRQTDLLYRPIAK